MNALSSNDRPAGVLVCYRVDVPRDLVSLLPSKVRTRVWLELAQLAQLAASYPEPRPAWVLQLGVERRAKRQLADEYCMSFALDDRSRTVRLVEVERLPASDLSP